MICPVSTDPTRHATQVRVRYGEVDRMGVVYHAHYLVYFEQGRTELLRSLGGTYRELEDGGTRLVVVETGVRHHRSAGYDDLLQVATRLSDIRGVRMRFDYEVHRSRELVASGFTVLAATDDTGRPRRLPASFREVLGRAGAPAGKATPATGVSGDGLGPSPGSRRA
jgi:acyl-CoA thioester hydrolase